MKISAGIAEFLLDHKGRGSRPMTIDWYKRTLNLLLSDHMEEPLSVLSPFLVNKVLNRPVKNTTLAIYDRALRAFCNWLKGVELIERNPFEKRKRIKDSFQLRQVLTPEEIQSLLAASKKDKRVRYRNQAMLLLFLGTGIRSSELARIKITDVDWANAQIKIEGKTGFSALPLSKQVYRALRLYVTQERKGTDQHLFLYAGKPLNTYSLTRFMNRLGKRAGIARPIGVHILRHTFATSYLRNGGDGFTLQRILRHSSPVMTQRYLHFVTGDLQEKLEKFSPLSKMV